MRKRALCFALGWVVCAAAGRVFAEPLRIGLEFGTPSGVIVIRPAPLDIKIGYDLGGIGSGGESNFLHLSCDYRFVDKYPLVDTLSLYVGAGGYLGILTGNVQDNVVIGGRVPVGVQVFLLDGTIEVFVEIVPTVKLLPTIVAFDDWQGFVGFTVPLPALRPNK
jgi:hypothetical protein